MNTVVISKENILETCKKIVSNKGLTAINMRLVAKECNIALGSIYYYFPSKDDLLIAIIESVWEDIFKWNDFEKKELNFLEFVEKLFLHIRINVDKYPNFFMIHSISLSENGKEKGYSKMNFYLSNIKKKMKDILKKDTNIRPNVFNDKFSKEKFIDFLIMNIFSLLTQKKYDYMILIDLIKKSIY